MKPMKLILVAFALTLPGAALAQTADSFNLTCAPSSHVIDGTDTFGAPISFEDYQGVIEETVLLAVDLKAATSCHPKYCTPDSFGGPQPIPSVTATQIVFDDIAAREVESNDYKVIAYRAVYDRASKILTTTFGFFADDLTTPTGSLVLTKSCTVSAYALATG